MKTPILLQYKRIFDFQPWFRGLSFGMIVYVWKSGAISQTITSIVQCIPICYQWNKDQHGTCIDQLATYRYIPLPDVIHNDVLSALPAPMIWQLPEISRTQKLALTVVFLLGPL